MSFRLKTILGIAAIEAVLLAFLVVTSLSDLRRSNEEELAERAQTSARLFASTTKDALLSTDLASLESSVAEMTTIPGVIYARVVSDDHGTLAESGDARALGRRFVQDLDAAGVDDEVFDTAAAIAEGGVGFGRVELGVSSTHIDALIDGAQKRLGLIALGEMVLVALFSALLGVYLTRQLHELRRAARAVAGGQLDVSVAERSDDEVGQVAHAFNRMTGRLRESLAARDHYEQELVELNSELEARVARRTARLLEANEALEASNRQLKETQLQLVQSEKMASVGQLAAGVAHEINNPIGFVGANIKELDRATQDLLGVLRAYELAAGDLPEVTALRQRVHLDLVIEELPELLRESNEGIERIREIVTDLMEFSQVGGGTWKEHDIAQALRSTLSVARGRWPGGLEVVEEYDDLPEIICKPSELNQVFLNLLHNAAEALGERGQVTLRARREVDGVSVEVEDDGPGIPPAVQERIFEPFFTTKEVGDGTGLGLSAAYGIIARHGGRIEVRSAPGEGACFRVWLPLDGRGPDQVVSAA